LKKLLNIWFGVWSFCQLAPSITYAQKFPDLHFSHLTVKEGLSSNLVNSIFQDYTGVIWICTENGFNRFDGNSIKIYKHLPHDSTSLPSNFTLFITEDKQHKLWITTRKGLYIFDPVTEKGETITFSEGNQTPQLFKIFCDSRGTIWVNTSVGVKEINSITKKIISYYHGPDVVRLNSDDFTIVATFFEGQDNNMWIGSYNINRSNKLIENLYFKNTSFQNHLIKDQKNQTWSVSRNWGLKKWDAEEQNYKIIYAPPENVLDATTWHFKGQDYICMSVYPIGVVIYNMSTEKFMEYKNTEDEYSVNSAEDRWVFKDNRNRLWFASTKGVDILDPEMQYFTGNFLYKQISDVPEKFGIARSFLETKENYYVSGHFQNGLFIYTKDWKIKKQIQHIPSNSVSPYSQEIGSIQEDDKGNIWFGTDSGFVKENNGRFKVYLPENIKNIPYNHDFAFRSFLKRPDGKFWIRHPGKTLFLFDPISEKFIKNCGAEINGGNYKIIYDKNQNLWVATEKGLYKYDNLTDKLILNWFSSPIKAEEVLKNSLRFAHCDNNNILWLTSEGGLIKFNPSNGKYNFFTAKEGLPEEDLYKIIEDDEGFLWINTPKGLLRYDKENKIFNYYTAAHGLPFGENALESFFAKLVSGNIVLGFLGGVIEFNPKEFKSDKRIATTKIIDVEIDDIRYPLVFATSQEKVVKVMPGKKKLKIHAGIFNYTAPTLNKLYFYIDGIDNSWQPSKDGNIIFYNLNPGTYFLHVKGAINNTLMLGSEDSIKIIIEPYWYQTILFKLFIALSILSIGILIYNYRITQIKKAEKIKTNYEIKMIHLEMQNLRSQMNPHFIFNSLNSINSFIVENKTHLASDYLTKFSRLIRLILENSKNEYITIEKELETIRLYLLMESIRFDKKFDYTISVDLGVYEQTLLLPTMIIQPYLENSIWHGLLHNKNKGKVGIKIDKEGNTLKIVIEDNGIGRKKAEEMKSKYSNNNKSYGMQITAQRILHLNPNNKVETIDLMDENGNPSGTKVIVYINTDNIN